jgi:hypothetical protein
VRAPVEDEGVGVPRWEVLGWWTGMAVEEEEEMMPVMEVERCGRGAEVRGLVVWIVETERVEGVFVRLLVGWTTAEGVPLGVAVPFVSGWGFVDGRGMI